MLRAGGAFPRGEKPGDDPGPVLDAWEPAERADARVDEVERACRQHVEGAVHVGLYELNRVAGFGGELASFGD